MGLTVTLYKNGSPVEKIGKNLTGNQDITDVLLKQNTSILRPVLIVNSSQDVYEYNYLYIAAFNRYYFIDDIGSAHNNIWEISAHVDVLETYKNDILSNSAVIKRQQNQYNLYLDDPEFLTYNYEQIATLKFPANSFDKTLSYVLVINGE